MSPDQKKRNDRLVSLVSLGLLVPLVVVVGYFLVDEIKNSAQFPFVEDTPVERSEPLSPEEVESERSSLPGQTIVPTEIESSSANNVEVRMLTEDEVAALLEPQNQEAREEEKIIIETFSDEVKFTGVQASSIETEESSTKIIQGSIFSVDYANRLLTIIVPNQQDVIVSIDSSTTLFINGRSIRFEDLETGDLVRVEGSGTTYEVLATTVSVIGSMEVLFTN